MADVYDERDELSRKLFELEEKINSIRAWLDKYGFLKHKVLPDYFTSNYGPPYDLFVEKHGPIQLRSPTSPISVDKIHCGEILPLIYVTDLTRRFSQK